MELPDNNVFLPDFGVAKSETYDKLYPIVNDYILKSQDCSDSRNGNVKELLDIKTAITNPYKRCVGGYNRDINIFFLLAEAMWIAVGRKDLAWLELFNSNMANFSDDGKVFHAPYGFRIRHWGIRSEDQFETRVNAAQGYDQLADLLRLFSENPNTRQVVLSVWNPNFDLGYSSKDLPCNDMVMYKIRNRELITTVQNRSNDLHWGLPTNIFQFSFLSEIIANCLDVKMGTQTHNSQSLHIYDWSGVADKMQKAFEESQSDCSLYGSTPAEPFPMDFKFSHDFPVNRLREIDLCLNYVIDNLTRIAEGYDALTDEIKHVQEFSAFFYNVYKILRAFLIYKQKIKLSKTIAEKDAIRKTAIAEIELIEVEEGGSSDWDVSILAKNFFAARLSSPMTHPYLGRL